MAYFRQFSNVISIKTSRAAQKNTSNMAATVGSVVDDVTCKSSIAAAFLKYLQIYISLVIHFVPVGLAPKTNRLLETAN
jgi:hypothetical protein